MQLFQTEPDRKKKRRKKEMEMDKKKG